MARTPAARRRRGRRLTPRRWLPFVALSGLVAAAAIVGPGEPALAPEQLDSSLDLATLPAVTPVGAVSTAWYCSGGSATGDATGLAELAVVVANDDDTGATAEVTVFDPDGTPTTQTLDVPAHGRARVAAADVTTAEWVGVLVEVRGGRVAVEREVNGPLGFDVAPCSTEASDRWYVPTGVTVRGAEQYLSLFNPFPDATSVDIAFATNSGPRTPRDFRGLSVPGRSVRVFKISDTITNRSSISATVRVRSGRLVVDRVQTFDGTGDELVGSGDGAVTTPAPKGLLSTPAIPARASRWLIPGARVTKGVRTQIAVYNPGSKVAEVDVVITHQEPDDKPEVEPVQLSIRPRTLATVDLTDLPGIVPDTDVWIDVRSLDGIPVVAERLSYYGEPSPRTGVAAAAGIPVSATQWMVIQGGAARLRSSTVQVANPGPADAKLTVFQLIGGDRVELPTAAVTVPGGDRRSLDLAEAGASATVIVVATEPVVVSSSMSLTAGHGIGIEPAFAFPETVVALPPLG